MQADKWSISGAGPCLSSIQAYWKRWRQPRGVSLMYPIWGNYRGGAPGPFRLDTILTNDIRKLADNQVIYAFVLPARRGGGRSPGLPPWAPEIPLSGQRRKHPDWDWLTQHKVPGVVLENISPDMGQLVQGPLAEEILQKLTPYKLEDIGFFRFASPVEIAGIPVLVSRTGYTGEDGFEIYCPAADVVRLWQEILREGKPLGLLPCGLGARDTLRFEAGLPLYGHEISQEITPLKPGWDFCQAQKTGRFYRQGCFSCP